MSWQAPTFDKWAFAGKRSKAISATRRHDGEWDTTGISFSDFGSMHVKRREVTPTRRMPTPLWSQSDATLRPVVLRSVENRLYIRDNSGTDAERMARIAEVTKQRLPRMQEELVRHQLRYHEEAIAGASEQKLKGIATEIANRDSEILLFRRGLLAVLVSVLYKYYREGKNSVQVATECNLKSPAVRIILWRMNSVAKALAAGGVVKNNSFDKLDTVNVEWATPENLRLLFALRARGHSFLTCSKLLKVSAMSVTNQWRKHFGALNYRNRGPRPKREPKLDRRFKRDYKENLELSERQPREPKPKREPRERQPRKWNKERLQHLFVLRASGKTFADCAVAFKCKPGSVFAAWRRHFGKLTVKPKHLRTRKTTPWTPERLKHLLTLRTTGHSVPQCAKALGVSTTTVRVQWRRHFRGVSASINGGTSSRKQLEGQKFGRLTVIRYAGRNKWHGLWDCVCTCGNTTTVAGTKLTSKATKSCGCRAGRPKRQS